MVEIVCSIIAAVSACAVALIGRQVTIHQKKDDARQEMRRRESLLSLQLMNANTELTEAMANAMLGGHNNGNVEIARKNTTDALKAYQDFHTELIAKQISK